MKRFAFVMFLFLVGFAASCAPKVQPTLVGDNLSSLLGQGYQQKVDNFLIIIDGSSSMWECYNQTRKIDLARNVALGINQSIDGLKLQAGVHVIGVTREAKGRMINDSLVYGMTMYSAEEMARVIKGVGTAGPTPIGSSLVNSTDTLKNVSGKTAVILISDGIQVSSTSTAPGSAAAQLKAAYGDRVCIYTIQVGDDPVGTTTLASIADEGKCGFATNANDLADAAGMGDFVRKVFFEKAMVKAAPVSFNLYVRFDFDKDVIRPQEEDNLDEVGSFLGMHKEINVTLEGHTCNMGPEKYNLGLSKRRAESVKRYLVNKFNIDPARLTTVGYGYSRPLESNDTRAGREANRRVMATINKE